MPADDKLTAKPKSLGVGKLIFRDDPLNIFRLAPDPVSKTSVCLDGHALNDRVNHWGVIFGTTLWPLGLVLNVFIHLVGMRHKSILVLRRLQRRPRCDKMRTVAWPREGR